MSRFKVLLGIAISVVLFAFLLKSVNWANLGALFWRTSWSWVFLSMALGLAGLLPRTARWRYLFPPGSNPPGLLAAMFIGYMANNVLPLRAGEVVRVYVVARRWGHGFWMVLATLIVERVLDSIALVTILASLMLTIPVPAEFRTAAIVLVVLDVIAIAILIFVAVAPDRSRQIVAWIGRRWPSVERRLMPGYDTFLRGLEGVRTPSHLVPILVWSVLAWIIPALTAWTMLRAVGLPLPLVAGWTVLAFVGIGISIPSAPAYIGVFHWAAILALGIFDVPHDDAVGYAILLHAAGTIPITIVGWIVLLREHMSLGTAVHARPSAEESALR